MTKINYDKKDKILSIRVSNRKSVDSDVQGNVVVDYDKEGNIVAIDIMPVSIDEFSRVKTKLAEFVGR